MIIVPYHREDGSGRDGSGAERGDDGENAVNEYFFFFDGSIEVLEIMGKISTMKCEEAAHSMRTMSVNASGRSFICATNDAARPANIAEPF